MGITHKILPHYTNKDIQLWNDRFELYDGFPVAMSHTPFSGNRWWQLASKEHFIWH